LSFSVKQVTSATRQVVSGSLYEFTVILLEDSKEISCKFRVWERPWVENGREVTITCDDEKAYNLKQQPKKPKENNPST